MLWVCPHLCVRADLGRVQGGCHILYQLRLADAWHRGWRLQVKAVVQLQGREQDANTRAGASVHWRSQRDSSGERRITNGQPPNPHPNLKPLCAQTRIV